MRQDHLDWPFFDAAHRSVGAEAMQWAATHRVSEHLARDVDAVCRRLVADLGAAGLLRHCVPARFGGTSEEMAPPLPHYPVCEKLEPPIQQSRPPGKK